jgi:hypothetical protein
MIYIYGDSHAKFSFNGLQIEHVNNFVGSITMFRVGRDNEIIRFSKEVDSNENIIVISYGEVDCRCHIGKQINLGRNEDDIIEELVTNYFKTIKNNIFLATVVIVGVIPPTKQIEYEAKNGVITHEFPFVGTDEDRVKYTAKVNKKLKEFSLLYNYIYFNPYEYYTRSDGTLKFELSDNTVHLGNNSYFLEMFTQIPFEERYA